MERLWCEGCTGVVYIGVAGCGGGFKCERGGDTARLWSRIDSKLVLEKVVVKGISHSVVARALEGREHVAMLMKIRAYSVLEGLKEFSVVCVGGRGVVRGRGKDSSWKSCSN